MVNTKLDKEMKAFRKGRLEHLPKNTLFVYSEDSNFTLVAHPVFSGSKMYNVTMSYCSEKENKNRRKVGEYFALNKLFSGYYIQMNNAVLQELCQLGENYTYFEGNKIYL